MFLEIDVCNMYVNENKMGMVYGINSLLMNFTYFTHLNNDGGSIVVFTHLKFKKSCITIYFFNSSKILL